MSMRRTAKAQLMNSDSGLPGRLAGAVLGALLAGWFGSWAEVGPETGALALLSLLVGDTMVATSWPWARMLPFSRALLRAAGPLTGLVLLGVAGRFAGLQHLTVEHLFLIGLVTATTRNLVDRFRGRLRRHDRVRIAVIGGRTVVDMLARELQLARHPQYEIVGRVSWDGDESEPGAGEVAMIGTIDDLGAVASEHEIDRLIMSSSVPRMAVFEEMSRSCLGLPVRLQELSGFYEETFGHVPAAEINAAWFQYIMHPRYRLEASRTSRVLDVTVAAALLMITAPLLAVFALLIRRDGGPVLFRQQRIGEAGRPFEIFKLRTMRVNTDVAWAIAGDPRVTRVGRLLRRAHLDELPQLINVLRGEMRMVGPRPEQPAFVEHLERTVPFYQRRHVLKPGITGWAQVRCGYAGSELGTAWKICHDLWYLKHRSTALDLLVLIETVRTLVADPQYTAEPSSIHFILAPAAGLVDAPVPVGEMLTQEG